MHARTCKQISDINNQNEIKGKTKENKQYLAKCSKQHNKMQFAIFNNTKFKPIQRPQEEAFLNPKMVSIFVPVHGF